MRLALALVICLGACSTAYAGLPAGFVGLYGDDSFFGGSAYRQETMSQEALVGVRTVRQPFDWWRVERRPGVFDWSDYDVYMAEAARAGIDVLPVLMAPPSFRSSRPPESKSRAMFPPKRISDYTRFVASAVRRYGFDGTFWDAHPGVPYQPIRSWQVWNEPNIPNFWRSGPDADEYVALLKHAARAIRRVDPEAEVVAAGLPNSALGVPFLEYLERMYAAGARGSFDTLAIHPYSRSAGGLLQLAEDARTVMDRHLDSARLWITEFGWSTGGDASAFRVSERGQANRIAAVLSGLLAERRALRLRGFVLFKWRDAVAPPDLGSDPWPLHTGLIRANGLPKRGFWTFARIVRDAAQPGATGGDPDRTVLPRGTVRLSPRGYARLALGCRSAQPGACAGTVRLRVAKTVSCGGATRRAGAAIGSAAYRISIAPWTVPVRLALRDRRLAQCLGRLRVRGSAEQARAAQASAARAVEFVLRAG